MNGPAVEECACGWERRQMTPRWWVMEKKGCRGQVYNLTNTQRTHVSGHALRAASTIPPTRRYAALSTRASDPMLTWSPRITGDLLTLPRAGPQAIRATLIRHVQNRRGPRAVRRSAISSRGCLEESLLVHSDACSCPCFALTIVASRAIMVAA